MIESCRCSLGCANNFGKRHEKRVAVMVTLGDSAGTQTQDPQLRRLLLYSAELPNQHLLASAKLMLYFDLDKILTHVD